MATRVEPLPECKPELQDLINYAPTNVKRSVAKLMWIWNERREKGFEIEGPGQILNLPGPNGDMNTVIVHLFPLSYAAGIVAVDGDGDFARILNVGAWTNQLEIDSIYRKGFARLKEWVLIHGSLR